MLSSRSPRVSSSCESGGIGRRARLRIWYRKVWGFESPLSHLRDYSMQFVDEFMWSHRLNGKWPLERIVDTGLRVNVKQSQSLQKSVKSMFEQGLQSHSAFQQELAYQARAFGRNMSRGSADVVAAVEEGSSNVVTAIQQMSDYLGSGLCEIRWAVERQNDTSLKILRVLIESLDNMSRQYFEQGIKWYENREYDLAKERFNKALEANMTNYFAYQYLGFISVAENDSNHAIRNFDLAQKIAETPYHRALALSHLARSYHAKDDLSTAADLTREATEIDPETAKFWYEFGGYSARLGRREESIAALNEAIEKDWTYFTVVVVDSDFDRVRTY